MTFPARGGSGVAAAILLVLALLVGPTSARAADVEVEYGAGMSALERGEYPRALLHLSPLARAGHPQAQLAVARMHQHGWGVARDPAEAARWFSMAAAQGVVEAAYQLAWHYHAGSGVARDVGRAASLFAFGADAGHAESLYYLGLLTYEGRGVPRDHARAAELFRQAAERGVAAAFTDLGLLYLRGEGVTANSVSAARLFRSGADLGHGRAMMNLGTSYLNGEGVVQDHDEAYFWFELAVAYGDDEVRAAADRMRRHLALDATAAKIAETEARAAAWKPGR